MKDLAYMEQEWNVARISQNSAYRRMIEAKKILAQRTDRWQDLKKKAETLAVDLMEAQINGKHEDSHF